jgi:hypothetical protein
MVEILIISYNFRGEEEEKQLKETIYYDLKLQEKNNILALWDKDYFPNLKDESEFEEYGDEEDVEIRTAQEDT